MMDLTRATQNIDWHGTLDLRGHKIDITGCRGTRDRSWGIRTGRCRRPASALCHRRRNNFTGCGRRAISMRLPFFCHTNDDGAGEAWNRKAVFDDFATGRRVALSRIDFTTDYHDGTRRVSALTLEGEGLRASFTPLARLFYMQGLGYIHPEWNHGTHHGSLRVGFDEIELAAAEAALKRGQMENLHVQTLSAVNLEVDGASHKGQGVIEQLFIGPHAPSGFQDLVDRIMT
jgi:hypothetical protein